MRPRIRRPPAAPSWQREGCRDGAAGGRRIRGRVDRGDDRGGGGASARDRWHGLQRDAANRDDGDGDRAADSASASRPTVGSGFILLRVPNTGPKPM